MKTQKLVLVVGFVLASAGGSWAVAEDRSPDGRTSADSPLFAFMQFSDVHVGHEVNRPVHKRLLAAIELANAIKPSFVICTGDLTTHPVHEATEANLAEFGEYKKCMARLTMPLWNVPGNHDIGYFNPGKSTRPNGRPWADVNRLLAEYTHQIGPLDQSFAFRGVGFILFNNNPPDSHKPGYVSDKQLQWIENGLKQYDRTFLFCHVQLLENGTTSPWGESAERLIALCRRYRVGAVAYGHAHEAYVKAIDGTQYIMCPDLTEPDHQAVYQYRVFADRFELWRYDVFSQEGRKIGSYPMLPAASRPAAP